jgi:hypothetical protein
LQPLDVGVSEEKLAEIVDGTQQENEGKGNRQSSIPKTD